jgi:hypothetical protein
MSKSTRTMAIIAGVLVFTFVFPRLLLQWMGPADPWTSYLYQYGFGLVTFAIGIGIILRSGACRVGRGRDGIWLGVLLGGFVFFATLHALWIVAAESFPYLGGN